MSVVGVDACRRGWIALELWESGQMAAHFVSRIGDLEQVAPECEVVAIDIPIGLPEVGRRPADESARVAVGARRNSVFYTPPRSALAAATHSEGTQLAAAATGFGMSQQAYALRTKIFEVEAWIPGAPGIVAEVHPEVSFTEMLGFPPTASKKSWQGMVERYRALAAAGIYLDELTGVASVAASVDDMLDAGAAAWTARRMLLGEARTLPDSPPDSDDGRPVAIWV